MAQTLTVNASQRRQMRVDADDSTPISVERATAVSTTLAVANMHCGSCLRKVETALMKVPGVVSARANLSAQRVIITTSGAPDNVTTFLEALRAAGFDATLLTDSASTTDSVRDQSYLKRLGVAGFAAANVMLLSVSVWSGHAQDMPASLQSLFHWLSALIAIPAVAYAGQPFFASARSALAARQLNMDVPISLGVCLATGMSLVQTARGSQQVYFDAAITLLFFLLIGRYLDICMRQRTFGAAQNLLGLRNPSTSVIGPDRQIKRISTQDVVPGMRLLIAAGERIPVDAVVASGRSDVDEGLITGESQPRTVATGDRLLSGTTNLSGPIEAVAALSQENSLLTEIARLMQTAEQSRGRYVRLADRAARIYAPAVHILGLITLIGWLVLGQGWEAALTAAIAVLIITCPCALALAVPAVQVVATGRLLKRGVIVKAADGLERLAEIDTLVFDKTGTLTLGEPRLSTNTPIPAEMLAAAASLAANSRHPYARAIVTAARARDIPVVPATGVEEVVGGGILQRTFRGEIRLGSARFCGIKGAPDKQATLWLRTEDGIETAFAFEDALRPDAGETLARLKAAGYSLEVLSGDRRAAVAEAAGVLGIDAWRAEQRPDQKIDRLNQLSRENRKVLMVGDGLNDAPALATAHASLSPSTAADISQTAADAIFQGVRLSPVIEVLATAQAARRRSLENFAIAVGYNVVFVPMAMLGIVTPLIAALAMSGSSIAVTVNALRLGIENLELRR